MTNTRSQHICDYCSDFRAPAVCVLSNRGRLGAAACADHISALAVQLVKVGGELVRLSGVSPAVFSF